MKARRRISLSSGSRCTIAWRPSRSRAMMDPSAATRPRAQARRAESMLISPVNWPGPSNATDCSRPATGRTISIPPLITTKKSVFWSPASNRSSPAWTPRCWPAAEMRESWASVRRGNICSYRSMYPGGYATGTQYAIDRANSFRGDCGSLAPAPEPLLEPVMGVGIVVERGHLAEAGAAVQRDSLTELLVRLQAERRQSELTRLDLERIQDAPPDPQPTHRVGDPHPLQRADARADRLHDATGDGLSIQRSEKERSARRDQVMVLRWQAGGGIESGLEPPLELGEVLGDAPARARAGWIDPFDPQTRDAEQKMHLRHCRNQPLALFGCEGVEQCSGRFVRPRIHLLDFTLPQGREPCLAHALIAAALTEPYQAFSRQRLGETTDVAGVEPNAPAQVAELRALPTDLVEQARRAQRAVAAEKVVVERADPLGDEPVEAPHLGNLVGQHYLTVVKYTAAVNAAESFVAAVECLLGLCVASG